MQRDKFEKLVEEALESIPKKFKKLLNNISVIVEDNPPPEVYDKTGTSPSHLILGLYHGVPYNHRGPYYGNIPPDMISIYQKPIEHLCTHEKEIKQRIRDVVLHEIGHYFGMSEKQLRDIENISKEKK